MGEVFGIFYREIFPSLIILPFFLVFGISDVIFSILLCSGVARNFKEGGGRNFHIFFDRTNLKLIEKQEKL